MTSASSTAALKLMPMSKLPADVGAQAQAARDRRR
jgi:hypothetical protein